jgi:hypothetical protein
VREKREGKMLVSRERRDGREGEKEKGGYKGESERKERG